MSRIIHFDDVISWRQSNTNDKFSSIREIFDKWTELLSHYFNPSECVTVDEQLLGFRGRCKFRQYMSSKPERYGIKFWLLVCSKTCYVWKIQPYLGKPIGSLPEKNQGERVILDLVHGLKGHNITIDNFFSSYQLGQKLLSRLLTLVGTMRKNKKSVPPKLLECEKLPLFKSTFAFTENTTFVSYIGRKEPSEALQSPSQAFEIPSKKQKTIPPIIERKSRCRIWYSEKSKYKNYIHQTMCCFCQKGACKRFHNRNICEKCIAVKLMKNKTNYKTIISLMLHKWWLWLKKNYVVTTKYIDIAYVWKTTHEGN